MFLWEEMCESVFYYVIFLFFCEFFREVSFCWDFELIFGNICFVVCVGCGVSELGRFFCEVV